MNEEEDEAKNHRGDPGSLATGVEPILGAGEPALLGKLAAGGRVQCSVGHSGLRLKYRVTRDVNVFHIAHIGELGSAFKGGC